MDIMSCFQRYWVALVLSCIFSGSVAVAQENPFAPGWDLDPAQSNLTFQSMKTIADGSLKVESSSFATFNGAIEAGGDASVKVLLESVDTKIDLRNVRMRFLFFETFKFPEAMITLQLAPDMVADLSTTRFKTVNVAYTIDLHGVRIEKEAPVLITLIDNDRVSVASAIPVALNAADFGLSENITKLEEAAGGIVIVPSGTVTFNFLFQRRGTASVPLSNQTASTATPQSVALEPEGDFSRDACIGRFEILSQTGNIYFARGSARLSEESAPMLDAVANIVRRCPELSIVISGHTDSDGGAQANQRLSEARARSVMGYLSNQNIAENRLRAVGYGEDIPLFANDSPRNKGLNRRIEFSLDESR